MYICTCMYVHNGMYHTDVCMCTYICMMCICIIQMYICVHIYMYVHVCTYIYIYIYICIHIHTHVCMCVHIYIYIYIYIHVIIQLYSFDTLDTLQYYESTLYTTTCYIISHYIYTINISVCFYPLLYIHVYL